MIVTLDYGRLDLFIFMSQRTLSTCFLLFRPERMSVVHLQLVVTLSLQEAQR